MTDHTLIVGAGIIGLLTARALLQQGRSVSLLDAGEARPCASWAAGGILSPLFPWRYDAAVTQLTVDAVARYQQLAEELQAQGCVDPQVDVCGLLALTETEQQQALDWSRAQGVAARAQTLGRPAADAVFFPQLGAVRNSRLLTSLRESLCKQGLDIIRSSVLGQRQLAQGWQVETSRGRLEAAQLVVAAGAWSAELLAPLGVDLPVKPIKGQMALYQLPPACLPTSVVVTDKGYLVPRRDGCLLVGSTLETEVADMLPSASAAAQLAGKWEALSALLEVPLKQAKLVAQWAGWRPGNVSDVPFIGELPGQPGLFVCTGHYRNGICAAPASVELLVAQLCGQPLPFADTAYALSSALSSSVSA